MKRIVLIFLSLSFLFMIGSCKKGDEKNVFIRSSKFKKVILESRKDIGLYMFQNEIPGLTLTVYLDNKVIWSDGLGYASKELKAPVRPDMKFRIGGTSKLFTGALMASLVQQDKLDLKQNLRSYYPELPEDKNEINMLHLASHSSGIREMSYKDAQSTAYQTIRNGLDVFIKDTLLFKPGQYFFESEFNYDLIGAAIERKLDKHYSEILKKYLTDTLHLQATICDNPVWIFDNKSDCYDKNMVAKTVRATTIDNRHKTASVGLLSSSYDIATLANQYLFPTYFKKETIDMILKPIALNNGQAENQGLGIKIFKDNRGRDLYFMLGSTKGGSSTVIIYPKYNLVIAMACNVSGEDNNLPVFLVADKIINQIDPEPKKEDKKETGKETEKK